MSFATKSTFLCLETLKSVNGQIQHLVWHQERFAKTRRELYHSNEPIFLASCVSAPSDGVYRIRVVYNQTIQHIEYLPCVTKEITALSLVESSYEYVYKYEDRKALHALIPKGAQEALIVEKGMLKDTTIANIALYIEDEWLTPKNPLLQGTTRERLIRSGFLKTAPLSVESLQKADKFAIINALIGFKIIKNITINDARRVLH